MLYTEGILWYLFLLDCLIYNFISWTQNQHTSTTHWLSSFFPLNRFFGLIYFMLIIWLGFALYRMTLLGFYFN